MRYKTITVKIEISGEEESVLKTATDLELAISRKINRVIWWRRLFTKRGKVNLDHVNIYQFPNN